MISKQSNHKAPLRRGLFLCIGRLRQLTQAIVINSIEDLRSAGVLPTGPVSAWPQERNVAGKKMQGKAEPKIKASPAQLASGLAKTAMQGIRHGKVSHEVREARYDICKACPAYRESDRRCSECGCFMEAKTWFGGDPDLLCPLKKWEV